MPDPVLNALFIFTGLLLWRQLIPLLSRAAHPLSRAAIHALLGLSALLMSNRVGALFGLGLGLNALTLPVSAGLGLPGTALLWALRYLL